MSILDLANGARKKALASIDSQRQEEFSQYFTPQSVASIMSNLVLFHDQKTIRLLDPGAGTGILTAAVVQHISQHYPDVKLEITAIEKDPNLVEPLESTLQECKKLGHSYSIINQDFVEWASEQINLANEKTKYDLVIQNPPYKKLRSGSDNDQILRTLGVTVPNIYAGFMALGLLLLQENGQQISITPRSWMNGTYFTAFRSLLQKEASLTHIHTFGSRSKVFGDTGVLQESIIVRFERVNTQAQEITISSSQDQQSAITSRLVPAELVFSESFVFVPATAEATETIAWMQNASETLSALGFQASTGKVVDFRSRDYLAQTPEKTSVPFVFSAHIKDGQITHPSWKTDKPQWFNPVDEKADKLLVPQGTYVVVKRFSAKEEKRRINAATIFSDQPLAFDNKTNYFHANGGPLDPVIAEGLTRWLNSPYVDAYFRVFSGHTQVNATDLRALRYPTVEQLKELGSSENRNSLVQDVLEGNKVQDQL